MQPITKQVRGVYVFSSNNLLSKFVYSYLYADLCHITSSNITLPSIYSIHFHRSIKLSSFCRIPLIKLVWGLVPRKLAQWAKTNPGTFNDTVIPLLSENIGIPSFLLR